MKILVVNGDCVQTNTSANLCHLAYIRGLLEAGHDVTLLSADGRDYTLDEAMVIPKAVKQYTYYGVSLYEKLSLRKRQDVTPVVQAAEKAEPSDNTPSFRAKVIKKAKEMVLGLYGVHGIYATFVRKAKAFRSDEAFDFVLSISTPVTSHLLTHKLLKSKHIRATHWIQIWEDPWHSDAYGFNGKKKIQREERRLLSFAEKVCYVSPITLAYQKQFYPESAHKMYWQPLPFYYKSEDTVRENESGKNQYGYFGDYAPVSRDLQPFYEAACQEEITVNICGNPCDLFLSTETVHIHPRLPLNALKPIEDNTNVLVFLCNRQGGQIPGKIYQYSATDKTILFIVDGTTEEQAALIEYFDQYNRYVFCRNTKDDIVRAIRSIENGDIGDVKNVPLDVFDPVVTIRNILSLGSE